MDDGKLKSNDNKLTKAQKKVLNSVNLLVGLSEHSTGQLTLLDSVLKDIRALVSEIGKESVWLNEIQDIFSTLCLGKEGNAVSRDSASAQSLPPCVLKQIIIEPSALLTKEQKVSLRASRGLIIIYHLEHELSISSKLASTFATLFKSIDQHARDLSRNLHLSNQELIAIQSSCQANSEWYKLISQLIKALNAYEQKSITIHLDGNISSESKASVLMTEYISSPLVSLPSHKKERVAQKIHLAGDLMSYNLNQLEHQSPKKYSGIPNLFDHLHPEELKEFLHPVIRQFKQSNEDISLSILMSVLLRCNAARVHMVSLEYAVGHNTWLDIEMGYICWNRLRLVNNPGRYDFPDELNQVKIPLPIEIAEALKARKHLSNNAKTLGDLFKIPLVELKKTAKAYCFYQSISSHKAFHKRLAESYSRFVLRCCGDEVYAAAISIDFVLGVEANFNYFVMDPNRVNQICKQVYLELGFSGKLHQEVIAPVGSKQGMVAEETCLMLSKHLAEAKRSFATLNNKTTFEELIKLHNQVAFAVTMLFVVVCGLRKAKEYSLAIHLVDLSLGLALVSDKVSTPYLQMRLVPLPTIVMEWLRFNKSWLRILTNRMTY